MTVYLDNDYRLELNDLTDRDGNLVTDATVNVSIVDGDGTELMAATAMTNPATGSYYLDVDLATALAAAVAAGQVHHGKRVRIVYDVENPAGLSGKWYVPDVLLERVQQAT